MLLYLVRHGQTGGERNKRFHGRVETMLSKKGIAQAEMIASCLKKRKISRVYCSSLKRAVQTGKIIALELGVPLEKSAALMEIDFGVVDTLSHKQAWGKFPNLMEERARDKFNFVVPEGESYAQAQKRAARVLQRILKKHKKESIAIVGHECINRTIIGFLLDKEPTWVMGLVHPHEYIYIIDTSKKSLCNLSIKDGSTKKGTISAT